MLRAALADELTAAGLVVVEAGFAGVESVVEGFVVVVVGVVVVVVVAEGESAASAAVAAVVVVAAAAAGAAADLPAAKEDGRPVDSPL